MSRISPNLQELISAAGPGSVKPIPVIVTLAKGGDWQAGVCAIRDAGVNISSQEEAILAVFGVATVEAVSRLARLPSVELIELDESARIVS